MPILEAMVEMITMVVVMIITIMETVVMETIITIIITIIMATAITIKRQSFYSRYLNNEKIIFSECFFIVNE